MNTWAQWQSIINQYVFRFQFSPHSPHKKKVKRKHWKRGLSMNGNYKGKKHRRLPCKSIFKMGRWAVLVGALSHIAPINLCRLCDGRTRVRWRIRDKKYHIQDYKRVIKFLGLVTFFMLGPERLKTSKKLLAPTVSKIYMITLSKCPLLPMPRKNLDSKIWSRTSFCWPPEPNWNTTFTLFQGINLSH